VCDYGAEVILDVSGRNLTKEVKPLPLPIDSGLFLLYYLATICCSKEIIY
jgi:hypothetical protein